MESVNDFSKSLPSEIWQLILQFLGIVSFEQWQQFRSVSKFWYSVVSHQLVDLNLTTQAEAKKALEYDLRKFGQNLRSLRFDFDFLMERYDSDSNENHFPSRILDSLKELRRLEKLRIKRHINVFSNPTFIELSQYWPNLRSLRLDIQFDLNTTELEALLRSFPSLELLILDFQNFAHFKISTPSTLTQEFEIVKEPLKLPCLETLRMPLESINFLLTFPLQNVTSLGLYLCNDVKSDANQLLGMLPHLKLLDLTSSRLIKTDETQPPPDGLFTSLQTLIWDTSLTIVHLDYIFQFPSLTRLRTVNTSLKVPKTPKPGSLPPPQMLKLTEWITGCYDVNEQIYWSWAVLQLVPNLKRLVINFPKSETFKLARAHINELQHLKTLGIVFAHVDESEIHRLLIKVKFWNQITQLYFDNVNCITDKTLMLLTKHAPNVIRLTISYGMGITSNSGPIIAQWKLTYLDLSYCYKLGTPALKDIAKIITLKYLDISGIPSVFTPHLRIFEPLVHLRYLGCLNKSSETIILPTSLDSLIGLWPRLQTLKISPEYDPKQLARVFGPFVTIIHEHDQMEEFNFDF
jgi:hypothetical protein